VTPAMKPLMRAAVMREPGVVSIERIDRPVPAAGEVLVRLVATGICHTDRSIVSGALPAHLPLVLGHEGAGIVESVGPGVAEVAVGDHVVLSVVVWCGTCYQCILGNFSICELGSRAVLDGLMLDGTTRLASGGQQIHSLFGQSSLAEYAVVSANSAVPIRKDVPLTVASLLSCGVGTGFGAVARRSGIQNGSSVVVIGCGGVGLAAVMAARVHGATTIVAVDPSAQARALAERVGATDTFNPLSNAVLQEVTSLPARGADIAIDAVGKRGTVESAFQWIRPGGEVVAVGIDDASIEVTLDLYGLLNQKRVTGTIAGSLVPRIDIPAAIELFVDGRLPLDLIVAQTSRLNDVPRLLDPSFELPPGRVVVCFD
jgi:Zn-dependent alcohol dehydrogenase